MELVHIFIIIQVFRFCCYFLLTFSLGGKVEFILFLALAYSIKDRRTDVYFAAAILNASPEHWQKFLVFLHWIWTFETNALRLLLDVSPLFSILFFKMHYFDFSRMIGNIRRFILLLTVNWRCISAHYYCCTMKSIN